MTYEEISAIYQEKLQKSVSKYKEEISKFPRKNPDIYLDVVLECEEKIYFDSKVIIEGMLTKNNINPVAITGNANIQAELLNFLFIKLHKITLEEIKDFNNFVKTQKD